MAARNWLILSLLVLIAGAPLGAVEISKKVDFELGKWIELEAKDGPITIHRIRVDQATGALAKIRPGGNSEYGVTVEVQLEFSNDSTEDWEAQVIVEWSDAKGEVIDGYRGKENLDEGERRAIAKETISTLRYGLDRAKTLRIEVLPQPE
jgi:hypothetical protein